jgi:hypothetical protein
MSEKNMSKQKSHLTADQIAEFIGRLDHADGVELKLTVSDSDRTSAVEALDMDVLGAEIRQIVFFDTPDLKLNRSGLILRARRMQKGADVVVKLRPVEPGNVPAKLRRSSSFNIEVDVTPGEFVCSGSFKAKRDNSDVKKVVRGKMPIRKLFTPEQRSFYKDHAPKGLDMNSLTAFGPINATRLKFPTEMRASRSMVAELWFYADGSRLLELSTKCGNDEAFQVALELRSFLTRRGIQITGEQQTKTRKALEYFSQLYGKRRRAA